MKRIVNAAALTLAIYSFVAWVYVAVTAVTQPQTLPLPLTHLAAWPRTDTFGAIAFTVSLLAFFVFLVTRDR